jgi:hypothetical protein
VHRLSALVHTTTQKLQCTSISPAEERPVRERLVASGRCAGEEAPDTVPDPMEPEVRVLVPVGASVVVVAALPWRRLENSHWLPLGPLEPDPASSLECTAAKVSTADDICLKVTVACWDAEPGHTHTRMRQSLHRL